jgi:hypothetical protein
MLQTTTGWFILSAALIAGTPVQAQTPAAAPAASAAAPAPADWRETYAYSVGMQAIVYGFPVVKNLQQRYFMVEKPAGQVSMPINAWYHQRAPGTSADKYGSSIIDTLLYSAAWYDVSKEPLVVTVPDAGKRYYSVQLMEMYSDIFGYIGLRATGNKAGSYAVVGPGWKGTLPKDIAGTLRSPTPTGMLLLRIVFDSRDNLKPAHDLQDQTVLAPLSVWTTKTPFVANLRDVLDPADRKADPLWFFTLLNRGMSENPPPAKDHPLVSTFASVGLGPNQPDDLSKLDAATQAGLRRAMADGLAMLGSVAKSGGNAKIVNQWAYGQTTWGRAGENNDFLTRAATQSLAGMQEHYIEEVVKLRAHHDGSGKLLNGADAKYVLKFPAGGVPKTRSFWSVTLYDERYDLAANDINRYSRGSPDAELQYAADGSLEIYIQAEPPAVDKRSNWLPAPKGPFNLFLRAYLPDEALIKQTWTPPPVVRQ